MNLDVIKQNVRTVVEVTDFYNDLIKEKDKLDRKKAKVIDFKIEIVRNYILKITENIKRLVEEEKEELQKNA